MGGFDCYCMLCCGPLKKADVDVGSKDAKALRRRDERLRRKSRREDGKRGLQGEDEAELTDGDKGDTDVQRPAGSTVESDLYRGDRPADVDGWYEKASYDPRLVARKDIAWLDECRTLGSNPLTKRAFISGLGKYDDWGSLKIIETGTDPNDPHPEAGRLYACYRFDSGVVKNPTYPFHEACYNVLASRLGYQDPADINKEALFELVLSIGADKHIESLRLDYGGDFIRRFWKCQPGEEYVVTCPDDRDFELQTTIWKHMPSSLNLAILPPNLFPHVRHDPLTILPLDILHTILDHLPVHDSLNLMKASYYICSMTRHNTLWRSMIRTHLTPWLWEISSLVDGDEIHGFDYKGLFLWLEQVTNHRIGVKEPFLGLANRRRVWGVCGLLVDAYGALLDG